MKSIYSKKIDAEVKNLLIEKEMFDSRFGGIYVDIEKDGSTTTVFEHFKDENMNELKSKNSVISKFVETDVFEEMFSIEISKGICIEDELISMIKALIEANKK